MEINLPKVQHITSRAALKALDTDKNGVTTSGELEAKVHQVDNGDHHLSQAEAAKLGLTDASDIQRLNTLLKQTHQMNSNEVIFRPLGPNDMQFSKAQAQEVIGFTTSQIPISSDRYKNSSLGAKVMSMFGSAGVLWNRAKTGTLIEHGELDNKKVAEIAANSAFIRHGNCAEMACLAAVSAKASGAERVELFSIPNHLFVVVNRDPASNPADPETWGPQALLLDPWSNDGKGLVLSASQYPFKTSPIQQLEYSGQP